MSKNNRLQKKESAEVHNNSMNISTNIFPIGTCNCKDGTLFMYLKSTKENIMNIYCDGCEAKRNFKVIDQYDDIHLYYGPSMITKTLIENYGEDVISDVLNEAPLEN